MFISSLVLLSLVSKFASAILIGSSQENHANHTGLDADGNNNLGSNVTFYYEANTFLLNKDNEKESRNNTTRGQGRKSPHAASPHQTSARNGRMLDLDALVGDFSASQAKRERTQTGNRQSRYLSANQAHSLDVGGRKLQIQGFIPIVGVKDMEHEPSENTKDSSSLEHVKSQTSELPYAQSSIGHASFPTSVQRYLNTDQQSSQQINAKFSGATVVDQLRKPMKKLAGFAYGSGDGTNNGISQQSQSNCLCVPFYMCKNGYISESGLGKSQIQQLIAQQQQQQQELLQSNQGLEMKSSQLITQQPVNEPTPSSLEQKEPQYADSYVPVDERSLDRELITMPTPIILNQQLADTQEGMANKQLEVLKNEDESLTSISSYTNSTSETEQNSESSQDILGRMLGLKSSGSSKSSLITSSTGVCGLLRTCCNIPVHLYPSQQDIANEHLMAQLGVRDQGIQKFQQMLPFTNQQVTLSNGQRFAQASQQHVQKLPYGLPSTQISRIQQSMSMFNPETTAMAHRSNQFQMPSITKYQPQQQQFQLMRAAPTQIQSFQPQSLYQQQQQAKAIANYPVRSIATNSLNQQQLFQQQLQNQPPFRQPPLVGTRKLLEGRCGLRQALGVNGRVQSLQYHESSAEFGEYPAQAAILKRLGGADSLFVCGGTLISQYWVATAAHCIKKYPISDLKIRLGEWDVHRDDEFYPFVEKEVRDLVVHPEFISGNLVNDIALLRLDSPVDPSLPHVNPACLPHVDESFARQRCWVTGWGKDSFGQKGSFQSVLREVELPVVGQSECESALRQTRLGAHYRLHSGFICAGGEGGRDACEGDGGSGLYCVQPDGLIKVAGLVSWGIGCGQAGVPGVYVNLAHYRPWIENIISIDEDIYSPYQNLIGSSLISERSNSNNSSLVNNDQHNSSASNSTQQHSQEVIASTTTVGTTVEVAST